MTHDELLAAIEAELDKADAAAEFGTGALELVQACRALLVVWKPEPPEGYGDVLQKTLEALTQ